MIKEFNLENLTLGISCKFGQELDCDYLFEDDGIYWGNVPATHNKYNYPGQIGDTFSSTKVNNRDISIVGYVYYVLTDDERKRISRDRVDDYVYNIIKSKKETLNNVVNPQDNIRITIGNYYIDGKPSATVKYGVGREENNIYFCKFLINIFCANPMFKKVTRTEGNLAGSIPTFHFPLYFNIDQVVGTRVDYQVIILNNEGNVPIGGKIHIKANAVVVNPVVENISTEEFIKINKTLQPGEVVTIDTTDGPNKGVWGEYNGVYKDYFQYWNFSNTWLKFLPGNTILGYTSDNEAQDDMQVTIDINTEKYGLEEM
jgi:hypothetical protein